LETLRKKLDADLFDRISLLTVHVPPLRECREDLPDDYRRVWRSLRRDRSQLDEAPTPRPLLDALLSAPLGGNLRDLQRLALLVMAYWPELSEAAITPALEAWQARADAPPQLDTGLGEGTRTARIIAFRRRLAIWAKERWGTWEQAARALAWDEATLRKDATRRGRAVRGGFGGAVNPAPA